MSQISPFLWFDDQAEEAVNFYVSVFDNAHVGKVARYGEGGMGQAGKVMTVTFDIDGLKFTALNGGPLFKFNESISFVIDCKDQAEVDRYWAALTADGGEPGQCGWLKDRFGVSWQVVPAELHSLIGDPDPGRAQRATQAMLQMTRLDLSAMRAAADAG
ncbi:MAG: VOC family protein [Pseudomonadota bacterium]